MRAVWNDAVLAEAPQDELVRIEGNWYFPPQALRREYFRDSTHQTECFWKGTASYYDVEVGGQTNDAAAWYYAKPLEGSLERVGADYTDYVAFWRGVEVTD